MCYRRNFGALYQVRLPTSVHLRCGPKHCGAMTPHSMEACRAPLTIYPDAIAKCPFYVLDECGTITGFYGLSGQPPRGEIEFLFVEPESVRCGRGQRLVPHFLALARSTGFEEMDVSADPSAQGFYVAMGAMRIAEVPSDAIPNRLVPRLRFSLLADHVGGTICLICTTSHLISCPMGDQHDRRQTLYRRVRRG